MLLLITYSYRIKQAMMNINLQKNNRENKNFVYMKIIYAIDMHRKAMRYVYNIMDMRYEA